MSHGHDHPGHDTKADYEHALQDHDSWFRHDPATEGHHQEAHGETNPVGILIVLAGTVFFVGVVAFMCIEYFKYRLRELRYEKIESNQAYVADSVEAKAMWNAQLSSFEWVDAAAGQVRIPIAEAKKLVMQDYAGAQKGGK